MVNKTIVATALACAACAGVALAQEAPPVFKSSVDLVPISALVRDGRGRPITTLRARDFEVRDNGVSRPILGFEVDDRTPITIAILVDTSGSMRVGAKMDTAREIVKRLSADLLDGHDEVGLFTFDGGLHQQHPFTEHPAAVNGSFTDIAPFGITSLYDAIAETARRLEQRPARRRAIVVLTDGVDTGSTLSPPEVSARASAIDAPVYVVATVPRIDQTTYADRTSAPNARSTADARDLALWTGGDLLWAAGVEDAAGRAHEILTEIRQQYTIVIEAAAIDDWRPLEVRVRDRHLVVRARAGYFAGDSRSRR
jgi:Ca-activated chloride channel family protein